MGKLQLIDQFEVESEELLTYFVERYSELGYAVELRPRIQSDSISSIKYLAYEMLIFKIDKK